MRAGLLPAFLSFAVLSAPGALAGERRALGKAGPETETLPAIEGIEIRRGNVFTETEVSQAFIPFGLLNSIHTVTRERFVARALIVKVGEVLDGERLAEAERNLRALRLFRRVLVKPEGTTVIVETSDSWTLLPRFSFSRKGGELTYAMGLEEINLLGTGRRVGVRYDKDADRLSRSFAYQDPQAFAPHVVLDMRASDLSDGRSVDLSLARPFYAFEVERAGALLYRQALFDETLYARGEEALKFKKRERIFRVEGGKRIALTQTAATRLFASVEWNDVSLLSVEGRKLQKHGGDVRRFLFAGITLEREGRGWIERRQVDQIDRDEDFNLAPSVRAELAISPRLLDAEGAGRVRLRGTLGTELPNGFALAALAFESRLQDGPREARLAVEARAYHLGNGFTIAGRILGRAGFRLDPESRLELDGQSGLRGYRLHAVSGTGQLITNLEVRTYIASELFNLVSLGLAAFADAGFSWGRPDGSQRLADVGVGVRLGLTRASKNTLLRMDIARALRPDPLGRTGWLLSFASGQAF